MSKVMEIADGQSGPWKIETFNVTKGESIFSGLREPSRIVFPGNYCGSGIKFHHR